MRSRHSFALIGVLVGAAVVSASDPALQSPSVGQTLNPQFEQFVDRYLKESRGGGSGDMNAGVFAKRLETQRGLLRDLQAIGRKQLSFDQDIDYRWLESIIKTNILRGERLKRWQQDPRLYMNINDINYKLDADPRPLAPRAAEVVEALKILETRLANAKQNLNQYLPRWVELSNAMIDGIIVVFDKTVPAFAERVEGAEKQALVQESAKARASVSDFKMWINTELPKKPAGDYKIGGELYNALHETEYMFDDNDLNLRRIARGSPGFTRVPGYYDWGWKQFDIVLKQLAVKAHQIDPNRTWLQIIRDMKQDHPSSEQLVFAHLEAARRTRQWVIDKDLVTIPWKDDDAIMVAAAPNQWMTQWWGWGPGVPAGSKSRKAAWTIIPLNPEWSDEVAEANLTEKDYSFMNVIAPHEVYPGHHLQRLYQNEIARPLRVYNSSYSNQSWCYYIEWELAPNYGFYPKEKQALYELEALRTKLWRMERVIVDAGLHTGKISYDDAIQLESERIGFVRRGAQINIDGIASGGSDTAAPTLGYFEWMLLREDYFKKMRELDQKGTLKDFHDRIYKIGFMPVTLVREALFHQLELEFRPRTTTTHQ
jgi:hypothetical protein